MNTKKFIKLVSTLLFFTIVLSINVFAAGWVDDGGDNWRYVDNDGVYATDTIRSSGGEKYYLDINGYMVRDYLLEDYNDAIYYFDDFGKMVKNTWVAVDQTQVYNQMDNPPSIYLYYFGNNGKAYRAKSNMVKKVIDGKKYLFNENGQMMSGWINESGDRFNDLDDTEADPFEGYCYYAGDETDGVLREGWAAWEEGSTDDRYYLKDTIWFYFKTSDNKKVQSTRTDTLLKRTINGRQYAFDSNGVMVEGWDAEALDPNNQDASVNASRYYLEEGPIENGRLAKKEWIFAVPSQKQDLDDHDAEVKRWFYSNGSGDVVKTTMKKINRDYYAFDKNGIMKSGLCVITKGTKNYVNTIDAERTDGKDFIISRHYISAETSSGASVFDVFDDKTQTIYYFEMDEEDTENYGKRKYLNAVVPFGDDDYEFYSKHTGEYEGVKDKKYYQNGIKLKADKSAGLGLVFAGYCNNNMADKVDYEPIYYNSTHAFAKPDKNHDGILSDYIVLRNVDDCKAVGAYPVYYAVDANGTKISKSNVVKKDKTGNYWLIGNSGAVMGIFEVPIRYRSGKWEFKSEKSDGKRIRTQWITFGTADEYGRTCGIDPGTVNRDNLGDYALYINDAYALNFRFVDQ